MRDRLMAMPAGTADLVDRRRVVFVAAVCAGMMWFAGRPDWRVLFRGWTGRMCRQVSQELGRGGDSV